MLYSYVHYVIDLCIINTNCRAVSQAAIAPLPPRPTNVSTSHQSGLDPGKIIFQAPNGDTVDYTVEWNDLERLRSQAMALDVTYFLQRLGNCSSARGQQQSLFKAPNILHSTCRLQQSAGGGSTLSGLPGGPNTL